MICIVVRISFKLPLLCKIYLLIKKKKNHNTSVMVPLKIMDYGRIVRRIYPVINIIMTCSVREEVL
jgi:hypothetical protein